MSTRFIRIVAYVRVSLIFKLNSIPWNGCTTLCLSILHPWTFGLTHLLAVVNNAATNMGVQIAPQDPEFQKWEFLDPMVILFLIY